MMLVLFSFLFIICGLVNSLFYFSPAKFLAWIFSLLPKSHPPLPPPPQPHMGPSKNPNKAELQMIFSTFDRNGDGFITKQELEESLENLGLFSSDEQLAAMIDRFDSNRDGLIDLQEFCQLYESMDQGRQDPERRDGAAGDDDLKEAFDVFDENGDGLISAEELRLVLSSLGLKKPGMGLAECRKMIAKVDVDGDGKVNFEEFKRMMSSGTLTPLS
ncbi:hypothetical protein ACLOJK_030916 [Asimina triloba]